MITAIWKENYGERVPKHILLSKQLEKEKAKLKKLASQRSFDQEMLLHGIDGNCEGCWEPQLSAKSLRAAGLYSLRTGGRGARRNSQYGWSSR
ncbi:hypothetical protein ACVSQB_37695 [Bradyrhizobium elkanii]